MFGGSTIRAAAFPSRAPTSNRRRRRRRRRREYGMIEGFSIVYALIRSQAHAHDAYTHLHTRIKAHARVGGSPDDTRLHIQGRSSTTIRQFFCSLGNESTGSLISLTKPIRRPVTSVLLSGESLPLISKGETDEKNMCVYSVISAAQISG